MDLIKITQLISSQTPRGWYMLVDQVVKVYVSRLGPGALDSDTGLECWLYCLLKW